MHVPDPSTRGATPYRAEPQSGTAGGTRRVFRQFVWLEVGSVKVVLSRPARAPGWCPIAPISPRHPHQGAAQGYSAIPLRA
jgi:hypothetical protein